MLVSLFARCVAVMALACGLHAGYAWAQSSADTNNHGAAENPALMTQMPNRPRITDGPDPGPGYAAERSRQLRQVEYATRLREDAARLTVLTHRLQAALESSHSEEDATYTRKLAAQVGQLARRIRKESVQQ